MVMAEELYHRYPDLGEGKLSRMRSTLVRRESLAAIARELSLPEFVILGEGELKSGGFNRDSILADCVESIIGAVYLESDLAQAKRVVLTLYKTQLEDLSPNVTHKDAKSRLQETLQKKGLALPKYRILKVFGKQHDQTFTVSCSVGELDLSVEATAKSSRKAEQAAAKLMLENFS
jgi:ribonuclease-3